jgi:hypothetical protein
MFRQAFLSTDALRRRQAPSEEAASNKREDEDEDDAKTSAAKKAISSSQAKPLKYGPGGVLTSSADENREPDVFDTHVGPFIERYVLWCQEKGVILGWIPGLLGVMSFITVTLAVGGLLGYATGQGILLGLDKCGLLEKLKHVIASLEKR